MESIEVESPSNRMPPQGIGLYLDTLNSEEGPARTGCGLYLEPARTRMDS
jgi:hypothetical protein